MSLKEVGSSLWKRIRVAAGGADEEDSYTARLDGGVTGYHPGRQKQSAPQEEFPPQMQMPPQEAPMSAGYTVPYQTTRQAMEAQQGFGTSKLNYASSPQAAFGFGNPGEQRVQQQPFASYQQPQTDYAPVFQQNYAQQTAYQPEMQPQQTAYQPEMQPQTGYQPQQAADNMRYMPGTVVSDDGRGYAATLRIAQLSSVRDCYRLIEFMRNLESVIVNVEYISDAAENQRCLDLLYGAAFAMQYTLTKVSDQAIYVISPQNILVIPYETIRYASDTDLDARWPGAAPEADWGRPLGGGSSYDQSRLSQRRRSDAVQRSRRGY